MSGSGVIDADPLVGYDVTDAVIADRLRQLGQPLGVRLHDRQGIGGPIALLLACGVALWGAVLIGGAAGVLVVSLVFAGAAAHVVRELRRWRDRIIVYENGIVQVRGRRLTVHLLQDVRWVEFGDRSHGVFFGVLVPFPLSLLLNGLGRAFFFHVHPHEAGRDRISLLSPYKSRNDEIDALVRELTDRLASHLLASLRRGESVVWTPWILITPEGLAVVEQSVPSDGGSEVRCFIPYPEITDAEIRHGHLLVKCAERRGYVVNSRAAGRAVVGWEVFRRYTAEPARMA